MPAAGEKFCDLACNLVEWPRNDLVIINKANI